MGVIPGGPLAGDVVAEPVSDWRFTDDDVTVAVETQGEWFNHSVTTLAVAVGPYLYIPAREGFRKRWVANAVRDPRVKIGVDGRIYKGRATRVTDPDEAGEVGKSQLRKYLGMDAEEVRQLLDPPAPGDDRVDLWLFRIESVGADS
jgi:hypothetical protein